jgi:hypothetical protein
MGIRNEKLDAEDEYAKKLPKIHNYPNTCLPFIILFQQRKKVCKRHASNLFRLLSFKSPKKPEVCLCTVNIAMLKLL